jgi:hypothetical protein
MIGRRDFITLLGGTAVAWPLAARAQQPDRMRRIGVLLPATADDPQYQAWFGAFLQGLAQSGWFIGRNVQIDTRWATANADAVRRHAAELAALAPDVILTPGASTVGPLLQATRTVPIVFAEMRYGDDTITIEDMDGLWKAIGLALITTRKALEPKDVRYLRGHMDLTQAELGAKLRVSDQTACKDPRGS